MVAAVAGEVGSIGPCQWIDCEATLCSACLPKLDEQELLRLWLEEFTPYALAELPPIHTDVMHGLAIVTALQLALKHPDVQEKTRHAAGFAHDFAAALSELLGEVGPYTAEVIRRGWEGTQLVADPSLAPEPLIVPEQRSTIIIPE